MIAASRQSRATLVLLVLTVAGWLALGWMRDSLATVRGDEGTYLAMAASLALDGDLGFDERDRARLEAAPTPAHGTVILQRSDGRIAYSKPVTYPLLAAPFYRLLGERGLPALNLLALLAALAAAAACLGRLGSPGAAALTLLTFAGAGVPLGYVAWKMSDSLQFSLALAGGALCLGALRPVTAAGRLARFLDRPAAPLLGGLLLGLLGAARYPNLLVAAAPVAALLVAGSRRRAALALAGGAAGFAGALLLSLALTGAANPYRAERASFTPASGYPGGLDAPAVEAHFAKRRATQSMGLRPALQPRLTAYSAGYFLLGRHTGIAWYFPAALVLALFSLRRPEPARLTLLGAALLLAVFYLVWLPGNYFGGGTFLGNRYFLVACPLLLLALPRLPPPRLLAIPWAVAAAVLVSALVSAGRGGDAGSQSHAHAGLFRWLPYESTAPNIEGRRDRYWGFDLLRFVDPFAAAQETSFVLRPGRPPAELEIVSRRPYDAVVFKVVSRLPELTVEASDWRGRRRYPVPAHGTGSRGVVRVELAPAWRRHPFWWQPGTIFLARTVRLAVSTPGGGDGVARVFYGGDAAALDGSFVRRVLRAELPERAVAGTAESIEVRLQNMSHYLWRRAGALPVVLGYRVVAEAAGAEPIDGAPAPLPADVPSGDPVTVDLRVEWPRRPGLYRLAVDLEIPDVGRFAERVGSPVAEGTVMVEAPE